MATRTIHTERLDLVPWAPSHTARLTELARTPDVVLSITRGGAWTPDHAQAVSGAMVHHWEAHGFGWRAMSERAAGQVSGFAGIAYLGENAAGLDPGEFELGCWVHPSHWRRGLAAEASRAVIDEAFRDLGAESVMGCARVDHRASIDGATALGLTFERRVTLDHGVQAVVLRVTAVEWSRQRAVSRA